MASQKIMGVVQQELIDAILSNNQPKIIALISQYENIANSPLYFKSITLKNGVTYKNYQTFPIFLALEYHKVGAIKALILDGNINTTKTFTQKSDEQTFTEDSALTYAIRLITKYAVHIDDPSIKNQYYMTFLVLIGLSRSQPSSQFLIFSEKTKTYIPVLEYAREFQDERLNKIITRYLEQKPRQFLGVAIQIKNELVSEKKMIDKSTMTEPYIEMKCISRDQAIQVDTLNLVEISRQMGILAGKLVALEQEIIKLRSTK